MLDTDEILVPVNEYRVSDLVKKLDMENPVATNIVFGSYLLPPAAMFDKFVPKYAKSVLAGRHLSTRCSIFVGLLASG